MKLERKGNPVAISGAQSGPKSFNIAGTRIAFNILSSGLYNDKIRAIIRELSCNAWDAHVMAAKRDVPFEIHLPTDFEPTFSIKDFGTGLNPAAEYVYQLEEIETPYGKQFGEKRIGKLKAGQKLKKDQIIKCVDEVEDLYCTYFSSNKNDSNEVIGAMGLGSKSPFCYCEGFTIINRYNGITRIYSAFIGESGTPEVVLQDTTATPDVINGLEVTFPVKQSDIWEFENKAKLALEFFTPRPLLNIDIEIPTPTYTIRTDVWGMRVANDKITGLRAIQGNVQYSVGNIDESKMTEDQKKIAELPLDIFFPIGQLAVAASRETLQLDETTVINILSMMDRIYSSMLEEVKKKIDSCTEPWKARVLIYELSHAAGIGQLVLSAHANGDLLGNYRNFTLNDKNPVINQLDSQHVHVTEFTHNWRSEAKWARKEHNFTRGEKREEQLASVASGSSDKEDFDVEFPVKSEVLMVINDCKIGSEKYVHYFLQEADDNCEKTNEHGDKIQTKIKKVFLFSRNNLKTEVITAVREAEAMMVKLGNPPCVRLSELKARYAHILDTRKTPTVATPARDILELTNDVVSRCGAYGYEIKGWSQAWTRSEKQPVGRKFYIAVDKLAATESGFINAHQLTDFVQNVKKSGKFWGIKENTVIYGLKVGHKLRENKKDWVDFIPYVLAQIKKIMTPALEAQMNMLMHPFNAGKEFKSIIESIAKNQPLAVDSPFQLFCADLAVAQKMGDVDKLEILQEVLEVAVARRVYTYPTTFTNFNDRYEEVAALYPMLALVSRTYSWNRSIENEVTLLDYLRTVDVARKATNQDQTAATAAAGN